MNPSFQESITASRMLADGLCADLPGQLLLIPLIGPVASTIASVICTVANAFLSLPDELLMSFSSGA